MLNTSGLSLGQAPPVSAPFLLFLVAPIFGIATGLMLITEGDAAWASRWTPGTLAAVHLAVLGFITPIMGGALVQILPVLYGAPPNKPATLSRLVTAGLGTGTLALAAGFVLGRPLLLGGGGALLAATLLYFTAVLLSALLRQKSGPGIRAILRLGIGSLGMAAVLGLALVLSKVGWVGLPEHTHWVDIHLSWGLLGWMGLVLVSVGSELMPMFYLSPTFPARTVSLLGHLLFASLLTATLWGITVGAQTVPAWVMAVPLATISVFSVIAGLLFVRRQRKIRDTTLGFWWLGLVSAVGTFLGWLIAAPQPLLGVIAIAGAGMSFTSGALYKIIPFLCWLHLRQRKLSSETTGIRIPNMKSFISERRARTHLAFHSLALALWAIHAAYDAFPSVFGSLAFTASSAVLLFNIGHAYLLFNRHLRALG